ncbi:hypothetical protein TEA_001985 [Camellia sinensis var. sinensis]|uniref:GTD-binding domain-containing protein n=1 Tax=Camellia sinensis var. sinensis TaxID=542762 RepID=A0A4V3WMH4_CAMSN|nr:hypothetical protein TEA_001985 [Camellia sinensis var. sinensis]
MNWYRGSDVVNSSVHVKKGGFDLKVLPVSYDPSYANDQSHFSIDRKGNNEIECSSLPVGSRADANHFNYDEDAPIVKNFGDRASHGFQLILEQALEEEHAARAALYLEVEKERSAAATAADEAMSIIPHLQDEKVSIEMEAWQYQRIIEEKSTCDAEEMNICKEILVRRQKEKHFLEREVEAYRLMIHIGNQQLQDDIQNDYSIRLHSSGPNTILATVIVTAYEDLKCVGKLDKVMLIGLLSKTLQPSITASESMLDTSSLHMRALLISPPTSSSLQVFVPKDQARRAGPQAGFWLAGHFYTPSLLLPTGVCNTSSTIDTVVNSFFSSGGLLLNKARDWLFHDRANELYKEGRVSEFVDRKLIPLVVLDQVQLCIHIGIMCTEYDLELRPTMDAQEIVAEQGPKQFNFKTLSSVTEGFHAKNKFGNGGFCSSVQDKGKELVLKEMKLLLRSAHHRNIVEFLGFCSHCEAMLLVFEFARNGSLDYLLFNVAPKVDTYNFGVVVLELISGQKNWLFHDWSSNGQDLRDGAKELYKEGRVSEFMDQKLIPLVVLDQVQLCIHIGVMCIEYDPKLQPTMGRVYSMLSENHSNIGLLRICLNDQWLTMALMGGFARIGNNEITIFVNDAERGSDIDPQEA